MISKTITYTDYNGIQRTETFWFNLSKAETMEMEMGEVGGMAEMIRRIIDTKDNPSLISIFKNIILKAYGEKSPDGRRFIKSEDISEAFSQTEAYSILFMQLATNADLASEFINGILPSNLEEDLKAVEAV